MLGGRSTYSAGLESLSLKRESEAHAEPRKSLAINRGTGLAGASPSLFGKP